jgi:metal-responsive CopG/Arc/MetJ family transcriptional regulator
MAQAKNSVRMSVDMPQEIYDQLAAFAKEERSSKARIIIIATAFYVRYAASQMAFGRAENFAEQILKSATDARLKAEEKKKEQS